MSAEHWSSPNGCHPDCPACEAEDTRAAAMDLDDLLEHVSVDAPGMWENDQGSDGYFAVTHGDLGIVAYFAFEADAFRFRLDLINRILNPMPAEYPPRGAVSHG